MYNCFYVIFITKKLVAIWFTPKHNFFTLLYATFWSSRKSWLLITIFAIHSPFLLPCCFRREEKREKITKVEVNSHAFLFDPNLIIRVPCCMRHSWLRPQNQSNKTVMLIFSFFYKKFMIKQKGMTFDHDFVYSFPFSLPS